MKACEMKKYEIVVNFNQKVVMDYRNSKLDKRDYELLRQKLKWLWKKDFFVLLRNDFWVLIYFSLIFYTNVFYHWFFMKNTNNNNFNVSINCNFKIY